MIFSSILPACATSEIPLLLPHFARAFFLRSAMKMAYFHCFGTSRPHQIPNDDMQPPVQGGIAVEGDLEQLNGGSVRSNSLSVCQ